MPARSKAHAAFGRAAQALRSEKDLTQQDVAKKMKVPATFVSDIERGVRNPSLSTILALAKALGVKASEILGRAKL